jgi:hypothetical protein
MFTKLLQEINVQPQVLETHGMTWDVAIAKIVIQLLGSLAKPILDNQKFNIKAENG